MNLISVTKQIIRAAAKLGIEEAGTRVMGSAWAPFKAMLSPVFGELEKRNPKFFLLDVPRGTKPSPSVEAQLAAKKTVEDLSSDKKLQTLVMDGFKNLEQCQYEIKEQIEKHTLRLEALEVSVDQLSETNDENFENVMTQLKDINQQLDNMGKSVGFPNQSILFPLSFELPDGSIEAYVSLYIAGIKPIKLSVNKNRPFTTVNVSVPKPGVYSYNLEHQEVACLYKQEGDKFVPHLVPISSTDSSQVEIIPNRVYKFERLVYLGDASGSKITMHLTKVLTSEEKAIEKKKLDNMTQKEVDDFLDSF